MSAPYKIIVPTEGESWSAFSKRLEKTVGKLVIILSGGPDCPPFSHEKGLHGFLDIVKKHADQIHLAVRARPVVTAARSRGIRVVDTVADLREMLEGVPGADEALRTFSPHVWRQQLRSRLQHMGLLSLPKLRVWTLIIVSAFMLYFVLFRLLPSAEVRIWPRADTISHTANIFLVQSGSVVEVPQRVRTLELRPLSVSMRRTLTFDQISKEFIGTSARVAMTVINKANETYSLRAGSRLTNQAGMVFRIDEQIEIPPRGEITVRSTADDLDLYGEIIGGRGNVPAGLKWEFPGLTEQERLLIYGENRSEATGGTSEYRSVLKQSDIDLAKIQLEQELYTQANQLLDEELQLYNSHSFDRQLERLYYDEFTSATYSGFVLPVQFIGESVTSVPIEGSIAFTAYTYNKQLALDMLFKELKDHVGEGKRLIEESVSLDMLVHHVIDYTDDLSWIKLTVDLTGKEQYILDPLSAAGARFAKKVRQALGGVSKEEAVSLVKNLPEVDAVEISLWPPWKNALPEIPAHISVIPVTE